MSSTGRKIYADAGSFGRVYSLIGAIIATIVGAGAFVAGVMVFRMKDHDTAQTQGHLVGVVSRGCTSDDQQHTTPCQYIASFVAKDPTTKQDKTYRATVNSHTFYDASKSDPVPVTIYYNPSNPHEAELARQMYKLGGSLIMGVAVLVIVGSWVQYYLARRYKFFAAAAGVAGGAQLIKDALR